MDQRHWRLFLWLAPLVCLQLILIATIQTSPSTNPIESSTRQAFAGTIFAQAAIAAAWSAFGPGRFMWRVPLSLTWIALLSGAMGVNGFLYEGWAEFVVIAGIVLFSQWLLLQFPLWSVAIGFGVQLRHMDEIERGSATNQAQFGIRELMVVTAIVAVLFGIGRIVVPPVLAQQGFLEQAGPMLMFFVVTQAAITFPLILATLLRQRASLGMALALALIALGTICEIPLMRLTKVGSGPTLLEIISLHAGTVCWIIVCLSIVRFNGYFLTRSSTPLKE